jgi:hypothetical protein
MPRLAAREPVTTVGLRNNSASNHVLLAMRAVQ